MSTVKTIPLKLYQKAGNKLGQAPGTLTQLVEKSEEPAAITLFEYDQKSCEEKDIQAASELQHIKETVSNNWINIDGIHDTNLVSEIGKIFDIHPLVLEDILNPRQRIKIEFYEDCVFIVLKMITHSDEDDSFDKENVSLILGKQFLISFQEKPGDAFDGIRERIRKEGSRARASGCDYLAYRLIDSIVDHYYVVLESYGEQIEKLETELSENSNLELVKDIQLIKRELLLFLRAILPLGEVLTGMTKDEALLITEETRLYLQDVKDHFMQVRDTAGSFRDLTADILDSHLSIMSHKMNEVMKVLTIFAAIFIPLTFIAGIFGMNFEYMPELKYKYSYSLVWLVIIGIAVFMLVKFKRKGWF